MGDKQKAFKMELPFFSPTNFYTNSEIIKNDEPTFSGELKIKIEQNSTKIFKVEFYKDIQKLTMIKDKNDHYTKSYDLALSIKNFYCETVRQNNVTSIMKSVSKSNILKSNTTEPEVVTNNALSLTCRELNLLQIFELNERSEFYKYKEHLKKYCIFMTFDEDYQIQTKIGKGSFGHVYSIKHKKSNAVFAGKIQKFSNQKSRKSVDYIVQEIEILRKVGHTNNNQLKLYEIYENSKYLILVTEQIGGMNLSKFIKEIHFKISEQVTLEWMHQMLQGLKHLHSFSVVHRDLKPSNIMLRRINEDTVKELNEKTLGMYYEAVVIDFGLCCYHYDRSENSFIFDRSGTVGYIGPETLIKNITIFDHRFDIFSLGIIGIVILTKVNPFIANDYKESLRNNYNSKINWASLRILKVTEEFIEFQKKMCSKNVIYRLIDDEALEDPIFTRIDTDYENTCLFNPNDKKLNILQAGFLQRNTNEPAIDSFKKYNIDFVSDMSIESDIYNMYRQRWLASGTLRNPSQDKSLSRSFSIYRRNNTLRSNNWCLTETVSHVMQNSGTIQDSKSNILDDNSKILSPCDIKNKNVSIITKRANKVKYNQDKSVELKNNLSEVMKNKSDDVEFCSRNRSQNKGKPNNLTKNKQSASYFSIE